MIQSFHKIAVQSKFNICSLFFFFPFMAAKISLCFTEKYQHSLHTTYCLKNSSYEKNHLVNTTA